MGANIGTTVTGQLIALDIGELAPLFTFIGGALALFVKRKQTQFAGGIDVYKRQGYYSMEKGEPSGVQQMAI